MKNINWVWWSIAVLPAPVRERQEGLVPGCSSDGSGCGSEELPCERAEEKQLWERWQFVVSHKVELAFRESSRA